MSLITPALIIELKNFLKSLESWEWTLVLDFKRPLRPLQHQVEDTIMELEEKVRIWEHQGKDKEVLYENLKFYSSDSDRTGKCDVIGEDHSKKMVVFRTPHGYHNIYICTKCLIEAAAQQYLKGD